MKYQNKHYRSIWPNPDGSSFSVIDQTKLPHSFEVLTIKDIYEAAHAITSMQVRGAPLIGATAAYGYALGILNGVASNECYEILIKTRPTAVNLKWALDRMRDNCKNDAATSLSLAAQICDEDVEINKKIGKIGADVIKKIYEREKRVINIMTHCNTGWIATVDYGTALGAIYTAHDSGIPVHIWVSETRPRNQGALTAWELSAHGVPHSVIVDNASGILMNRGKVDIVIVGTDRVAANGDVANKIGTYMKAVCAKENNIPFYVAAPLSSIDLKTPCGDSIEIEERDTSEVLNVMGQTIYPNETAINPAFDVTPYQYITDIWTENGSFLKS